MAIAMKDLEIRGAGNLLGGEQSGHIADVGFDLYVRLVGEAVALTVGSDTLYAATPANRPHLANGVDNPGSVAVILADATTVTGVEINPPTFGTGITGGGPTGATIADVKIIDSGTYGDYAVQLFPTAGSTYNISNLIVDNSAACTATEFCRGVVLSGSGTVNFVPTGTISITSDGGKPLDVSGVSLGTSEFDTVKLTNGVDGGVVLSGTTGTAVTFTNLDLTTTSGSEAALALNNAANVTVSAAGTATISATGGPAVSATSSAASLSFDSVSSTNSSTNGILLSDTGAGTFTIEGGGDTTQGGDASGGFRARRVPGRLDDLKNQRRVPSRVVSEGNGREKSRPSFFILLR